MVGVPKNERGSRYDGPANQRQEITQSAEPHPREDRWLDHRPSQAKGSPRGTHTLGWQRLENDAQGEGRGGANGKCDGTEGSTDGEVRRDEGGDGGFEGVNKRA